MTRTPDQRYVDEMLDLSGAVLSLSLAIRIVAEKLPYEQASEALEELNSASQRMSLLVKKLAERIE